jgi:hypothetical protein
MHEDDSRSGEFVTGRRVGRLAFVPYGPHIDQGGEGRQREGRRREADVEVGRGRYDGLQLLSGDGGDALTRRKLAGGDARSDARQKVLTLLRALEQWLVRLSTRGAPPPCRE